MTEGVAQTMYDYYIEQNFQPTFANNTGKFDYEKYKQHRTQFFTQKLKLPKRLFQGAELIEFGPDTGENALVFAEWGAKLTLCEPNPNCLKHINQYFEYYQLKESIRHIYQLDLLNFPEEKQYDLLIAEGFIYTIQPSNAWLKKCSALLKDQGMMVVSYFDDCGSFVELFHKLLFSYIENMDLSKELAKKLFLAKWNSIPHTRSFESWTKDVLLNPFVRLKYSVNLSSLLQDLYDFKLNFYSSWPIYDDATQVYWHKAPKQRSELMNYQIDHIQRSSLSYVLGENTYMYCDRTDVIKINAILNNLIKDVDAHIDSQNRSYLSSILSNIDMLLVLLGEVRGITNKDKVIRFYTMIQSIINGLYMGDVDQVIKVCSRDALFINIWGIAHQYLVMTKEC